MDVSSYTAFNLRLQWLESILSNPQSTVNGAALSTRVAEGIVDELQGEDGEKGDGGIEGKDITQRTGDLAQDLRNAVLESGHDSLRRLVDECESLLFVVIEP